MSCFFVHLSWRHFLTTMWKRLILHFVEDMNTRQQLSFSFRFEAAQIHFLSDIFAAVAITVAPYWQQNTYCTTHSLTISCQPTRQSRSSSKSTVCWLRWGFNEKHSCSSIKICAFYHKNNAPPTLMTNHLELLIIRWFSLLASSFYCTNIIHSWSL